MAIKIKKTWLEVYFTATQLGTKPQTIELSLNYDTKEYTIMTGHEESVGFKGDSIAESKLKLKALDECMKFIQKELSPKDSVLSKKVTSKKRK